MSTPDPFADDTDSDRIAALAAAGLTPDEIGTQLGMTADAVRQHPAYAAAPLTAAADARVERALWERATGAVSWSETITKLGERVRLERKLDPDVAAAKLYLQARAPDRWGASPSEGGKVYVVALPMVAGNAGEWLQAIERERAAIDVTPGGRSDGRGGE